MNETSIQTAPVAYSLSGVGKRYGTGAAMVQVLDGVDLTINRGDFVAIVGPSGSGKSTLLQLLGALDRPTTGEIRFEDEDIAELDDYALAQLRRDKLGFVFQQFNLVPTLDASDNIELAMAPTGATTAERRSRVAQMLESVGLSERATHLPSQLSGGEQQRVAIARALVNSPEVLLADEPTGNLDSKTSESILAMLFDLWRNSELTIVLITHDKSIAERAPRIVRIEDGELTPVATTPVATGPAVPSFAE